MSTETRNPAEFLWARLWIVCSDCQDEIVIDDTVLYDVPDVFTGPIHGGTGFSALDECLEGGWWHDEYGDWHCFKCKPEVDDIARLQISEWGKIDTA